MEKDRIIELMEHENLSYSKFAEAIGIQRPAMSHIISGRNNPSLEVMKKILETFRYVSPDWLIFGEGDMMRDAPKATTLQKERDLFSNLDENPPKVQVVSENRPHLGVESAQKAAEKIEPEQVIIQKNESKKIEEIKIFFSDGTFDTFVPEKEQKRI